MLTVSELYDMTRLENAITLDGKIMPAVKEVSHD